ncbi:MAG: right-handed parallel beta-helix repeat-containing protein [Pseudomonadota bacterium]|nr:right-handed parallel beta-helix repeat-containing protein [Pseudomonadota bacterium]
MRKNLTTWATAIAVASALLGAPPAFAANTTYYVDATGGSDSNAGTSQAAAWKTLAKVNAATFSAGDKILLRAGQQWVEQLKPRGSGVSGNPITIGAYGDGPRPIVDGRNVAGGGAGGAAVLLHNVSHWTVTGLEVVNDNGTNNVGTTSARGLNRSGIMVYNTSGTGKFGIVIRDNYVHSVNGCFECSGANAQTNGGIAVVADTMNGLSNGSSGYDGVQILDNVVERVGRTGIVFNDNSTGFLFYLVAQNALSKNVTIAGNRLKDIEGDGIILAGSVNNLIEHNRIDTAGLVTVPGSTQPGTVGMFIAKTTNSTMQYNEVSGVRFHVVDGQAYDVDLMTSNSVVQYNYSHDNEGGMILLMGGLFSGTNATVRYNLSVNDAFVTNGVFTLSSGLMSGAKIYNNTVFIAPGLTSRPTFQSGWDGDNHNAWTFRNNVIVNHGTGTWEQPIGSGTTISHNLIWGNHTAGEPADAYKIIADPQMIAPAAVAPEGLAAVAGYGLAPTSPAAGSGAVISGNGERDYFGNTVPPAAAPTRGFHEVN